MRRHLSRLFALGALPLITLAAPIHVGTSGVEVAECAAMPSCAPAAEWICIHGSEVRYDMCDPDSPGCLEAM